MFNAFAHNGTFTLGCVGMKLLFRTKNKEIIVLVDTVLVAIGIGGTIQLALRQPVLPCTASGT